MLQCWRGARGSDLVEFLKADPNRCGNNALGNWGKLADRFNAQEPIERVTTVKKFGLSRSKTLQPRDVLRAVETMNDDCPALDRDAVERHGLMLGPAGLLTTYDKDLSRLFG